ncbi:MAG: LysM peptidoglycan-binding domain-containing protein [Clostridiales bacterium]|nr:LysM peptidoglycan-binding domain-containing protein [Clostridiales bacterium]MCF8023744.1 LysM peptidoglycan-binding domain-containing protein [Clostridiales bacterium]
MKYLVQPNENLETLAARFGVKLQDLQEANPLLPGGKIYPGMIVEIAGYKQPDLPADGYISYVIQPGDTLNEISRLFNLDLDRIIAQNPQITNPDVIWPGIIIYLIYLGY